MKIRHLLLGTAALALGAIAFRHDARASGGTQTTTFGVEADVANACTVSASNISFGNITASSTGAVANNGSSGVVVTCTADGTYDVGLVGANTTGEGTSTLNNASQSPIPYTLYQDSGATTLWGNTPGTNTLSTQTGCSGGGTGICTGTGSAQDYEVWAKLGTLPIPLHLGAYTDTVTVTVTYY